MNIRIQEQSDIFEVCIKICLSKLYICAYLWTIFDTKTALLKQATTERKQFCEPGIEQCDSTSHLFSTSSLLKFSATDLQTARTIFSHNLSSISNRSTALANVTRYVNRNNRRTYLEQK